MEKMNMPTKKLTAAELQQCAILASSGNPEAAGRVLESLYPVLRKYARERGGSDYAQDYFQEGTLLAMDILRKRDIRQMKNFAGYFKTAYIHLLDQHERDRRMRESLSQSFEMEIADQTPVFSELEEELSDEKIFSKLMQCLEKLRLSERDAMILTTRILRRDAKESADFLKMTTASYYYHLRKIKSRFKVELGAL